MVYLFDVAEQLGELLLREGSQLSPRIQVTLKKEQDKYSISNVLEEYL
jgi:hypothetical protein